MTPEGPAHLVAWSWRCRMVGSLTAAAGTSSYPPLGTDAKDTPVLLGAALLGRAPTFTELDSPVQPWATPWAGTRGAIWGQCSAWLQCDQTPVVAWPVPIRSRLSLGPSATKPR